jgi:hypothetical protein
MHVYEIRRDHRGFDLISHVLPSPAPGTQGDIITARGIV